MATAAFLSLLCAWSSWCGYSTTNPLIQDDVVVLGVLMLALRLVSLRHCLL